MKARHGLALLLLGVAAGCGPPGTDPAGEDPGLLPVTRAAFPVTVPGDGELQAVRTTTLAAPDVPLQGLTISSLLPQGTRVREGEVIAEFDPSAAVRMVRDEKADHREAELESEKARTSNDMRTNILVQQEKRAEVDLAQADSDLKAKDPRISSRHERIEAELGHDVARLKLDLSKKKRETQSEVNQADLDILEIAVEKTGKELELAEKALDSMKVKAPHDGIVIFKNRWGGEIEVGETLWPMDRIGEIPDLSEFEVKCYVLERDAAPVRKNQVVRVRLDALPDLDLRGKVKSVANVANPRHRRSPVKYFEVIVSLENQDPEVLRLGMKARVVIHAERLEEVLIVPRFALREESGETFVYVMEEGRPRRRGVEIGEGTRELVAVVSGLEEGDVVLLRRPPGTGDEEEHEEDRT
jgi:RND family efflux transporter MFP subunit